ncbi:GumC family protein [Pelagibacterium xiamenense]|uniref:GumC family protein n=1 Tax=Pelagibacterium xiamenense TaxID=2901140 RepID=UPI001E5DB288|nr:Wzz/FepE/Etk N-terminal domain-containing protein [Pelagibacterium xiamenense]MCD7058918.1 Wzz/FepE/Etk N-terminal domain-containing protein [Pelagibacterium xiamenense]
MDEPSIDIRGALALLRRQKRLIIGTFLVVVGLAVVVIFSLTPRYSSSALIFIDPANKNLLDPTEITTSGTSESSRVDSEVEIIQSQGNVLAVIQEHGLVSDPEFGVTLSLRDRILTFLRIDNPDLPTGDMALRDVVENFQDALSVRRRGITYLVDVTVESEDPDRAAELANALADSYIAQQVRTKIESVSASQAVLEARLAEASDAIVRAEEAFDAFVSQNLERLAAEAGSSVESLRAELLSVSAEREATTLLLRDVNRYMGQGDLAATVTALENDALAALDAQRRQLSSVLAGTDAASPAAIDLRNELAAIEAELEQGVRTQIDTLSTNAAQLESSESRLREQIRSDLLASDLPIDMLTRLYELQQAAQLARSQYQTLLSRSFELGVQTDLQIADSRIISRALPARSPSFPNTNLMLALAALGGLGLGVGLGFLYENYIGGLTSKVQTEAILRLPVLAEIPRQKHLAGAEAKSVSDVVVAAPLSHYAEAVRRLRAGIDRHLNVRYRTAETALPDARQGAIIMVSSPLPAEGKTTVALSLARTYALSGKKTIIIDCDLRKPAVHRQLDIAPEHSLWEYLKGDVDRSALARVIFEDAETGLSVLAGARHLEAPADQLFQGKAFEELIKAATRSFDVVILDAPPILPVVDGSHLAQYADILVLVVKWASTSQSEVRNAVTILQESCAPEAEIAVALNQQERGQSSYGGRYASYYQEI